MRGAVIHLVDAHSPVRIMVSEMARRVDYEAIAQIDCAMPNSARSLSAPIEQDIAWLQLSFAYRLAAFRELRFHMDSRLWRVENHWHALAFFEDDRLSCVARANPLYGKKECAATCWTPIATLDAIRQDA